MKKKRINGSNRPLDGLPKFYRIMKLISLFMFVAFFQVSASVYSQSTKLNIVGNNLSLQEVFEKIEDQSEFSFIYNLKQIDLSQRENIEFKNKTVDEILDEILKGTDITYTVNNRLIVVHRDDKDGNLNVIGAEQASISGKVSDEKGEPLPGVTVVVKGTTTGTVTDFDGNYTFNAKKGDVLVFSFVGMTSQEFVVGSKSVINVTMAVDAIGIEEVVAIGYGTQKKVNLTGAVGTINGEDLIKRPVTNAASMMQGMLPGVQIIQDSGEPGNEGLNIQIRGKGTFSSAGSNPLVLIDGVQGNLSDLNPNDIENISVLKDAASASIYGSRAANGVVLVTTKLGDEGKVNIEYSGNYAIHTPTKMFDLITNSAEYMELYNEAKINTGDMQGLYTQAMIDAYRNATDRNQFPNYDWIDANFNPSPTQTHNLSFSGGTNGTRFNVSLGYVNQDGVMDGFSYEKYNLRINLKSQVNDKIKFGGNFSLKKGDKSAPRQGADATFISIMAQPPTYAPTLADGSGRYTYKAYPFEQNNKNPLAIIENGVLRNTDDYAVYSQGWLDVQLFKGLQWYTKAAINLDFSKYDDYRPIVPLYYFQGNEYAQDLDVGGSGLIVRDDQNVYKNIFTYLTFDRQVGIDHTINAQVGYSMEDNANTYLQGYRKEYSTDVLRQLDAGGQAVQTANGSQYEWALMSYFGRLGYNFKNRYLVEANLRYDGSSRLSPDSRWGAFPSFSAGWRVTEEQFVKDLEMNWLENLKFRGSYGKLGNQNIGNYPYQAILNFTGNYSFDDATLNTGVAQTSLSNPSIKWETTTMIDFGFDLTVFKGLNFGFDWYKKTTKDILRNSQLTNIVGLTPPTVNNGTMENKGFELNFQYHNGVNSGALKGLKYNIGVNLDHYKNKLVDFGAPEIDGYSIRKEGSPWETFYMLEWIGIFQTEQEVANSPKQYNDATVPGDLKFKDQNGDGSVNDEDRILFDGKYPALNYSLLFNAEWKGFDLSAQFQGVDNVKYFLTDFGTIPFRQGTPPTTEWRNRWTKEHPSTTLPRLYIADNAPPRISRNSTFYLKDGSYFRVKNITLGYTLPEQLSGRIGIEHLRFYFSGDNLFTLTNYPGLDPERVGSGLMLNYPQNKIYSFGINVKF